MSDSNRISLGYKVESAYGTFPAGNFQEIRVLNDTFAAEPEYVTSNERRSDRQRADVIRQNFSASGGFDFELSYGTFDSFFQYMLYSAGWSTAYNTPVAGVTFLNIAASSTAYPQIVRAAGDWSSNFAVGQIIRVEDANTAGNRGYMKIISLDTATAMSVMPFNATGDLTTDAASTTTTIHMGAQIVNGTTQSSVSFARIYTDLTNVEARYTGQVPETLSLSINTAGIVTGSFGFIGKTEVSSASPVTVDAATTTAVMNSVGNVKATLENSALKVVTGMSFSLTNNNRPRRVVGLEGSISIGSGTFDATGSLESYFADSALVDRMIADTPTNKIIVIADNDVGSNGYGNAYAIEMTQLKFTSANRAGGAINTDTLESANWTAYRDPSEGITMRIARFAQG